MYWISCCPQENQIFLTLPAPHIRLIRPDAYIMYHAVPSKLTAVICRLTMKNTGSVGHIPSCYVPQLRFMFNIAVFILQQLTVRSDLPQSLRTSEFVGKQCQVLSMCCHNCYAWELHSPWYAVRVHHLSAFPATNQMLHAFSSPVNGVPSTRTSMTSPVIPIALIQVLCDL